MPDLQQLLARGGFILADGATGTMLQASGLPPGEAPERWNLEKPEMVQALHRAYVEAGAEIIVTNSFGGNSLRLRERGLERLSSEINRTAARLAREASQGSAAVAGSMGPIGALLEPGGPFPFERAREAFGRQAEALAAGGADFLLIETMGHLEEARAAVEGAQQGANLPVALAFSFSREAGGRFVTLAGVTPSLAARFAAESRVAAAGANCGRRPEDIGPILTEMQRELPELPLIAKPSAGSPRPVAGKLLYDFSPPDFAALVLRLARSGARIAGGCCGTTPDHIRAARDALAA